MRNDKNIYIQENLRFGEVTTVVDPDTVTVTFEGEPSVFPIELKVLHSYQEPGVGQRVACVRDQGSWLVIGSVPEIGAGDSEWITVGGTGVSFENSWVNYGGGHTEAAYRMDAEGWIHLKGLVKSGTAGATMFTLPSGYRPDRTMYIPVVRHNAEGTWLAIFTDGRVIGDSYGTPSTWTSLSGIQFPSAAVANKNRTRLWVTSTRSGVTEQNPTLWRRDNGMVVANGICAALGVAVSGRDKPSGQFCNEYSEIFAQADSTNTHSNFQVQNQYYGYYHGTTSGYTMVNGQWGTFDIADEWIAPSLLNSWVNYGVTGSDWVPAGYWKDQYGFVHIRGMIKSGSMGTTTPQFTLPSGYRPDATHIFACQSNGGVNACRVDVQSDGDVIITNNGSATWTSLSGISFYADN